MEREAGHGCAVMLPDNYARSIGHGLSIRKISVIPFAHTEQYKGIRMLLLTHGMECHEVGQFFAVGFRIR